MNYDKCSAKSLKKKQFGTSLLDAHFAAEKTR